MGIPAPIQGTIIKIQVEAGNKVAIGMPLIVMEAMKMEHQIKADRNGIINSVSVSENEIIVEGHPLVFIEEGDIGELNFEADNQINLDEIRPDLQETFDRHAHLYDENRPKAVERRRQHNQRTAERTSKIYAMKAHSLNMALWFWPHNANEEPSTGSEKTPCRRISDGHWPRKR